MRAVVVGGGAYGLACAERLARSGASVLLVEAAEPGHRDAASGGLTRVLRLEYGGDARYSELTARAVSAWRQLERESGETLFAQLGVVHLAHGDGAFERRSYDVVAALGQPVELLELADVARRWPAFRTDDLSFALYSPTGGLVWSRRATRALAARARAAGVDVRAGARAVAVNGGTVALDGGERLTGDQVVLCCGSWSGRLDERLAAVVPLRQTIAYLDVAADVPVFGDGGLDYYGMPPHGGLGLKVARHDTRDAVTGDPADAAEREPRAADLERLRAYAAHRFHGADGAGVQASEVCFYAMTPDEHPILDRLDEQTVACCGLSGHGYKFAPVLATAAADLALGRQPEIDVRGFEHDRPALRSGRA